MIVIAASDFHYGHQPANFDRPFLQAVQKIKPDLIMLAGDLTHTGTRSQFAKAQVLVQQLKKIAACLCIEGNHDVPLDNPLELRLAPRKRFAQYIPASFDLGINEWENSPSFINDDVAVIGLTSRQMWIDKNHPFDWRRPIKSWYWGKPDRTQLAKAERFFIENDPHGKRQRIIMMHHPFILFKGEQPLEIDEETLAFCQRMQAIVISGHDHEPNRYQPNTQNGFCFLGLGAAMAKNLPANCKNSFWQFTVERGKAPRYCRYDYNGTAFVPAEKEQSGLSVCPSEALICT